MKADITDRQLRTPLTDIARSIVAVYNSPRPLLGAIPPPLSRETPSARVVQGSFQRVCEEEHLGSRRFLSGGILRVSELLVGVQDLLVRSRTIDFLTFSRGTLTSCVPGLCTPGKRVRLTLVFGMGLVGRPRR